MRSAKIADARREFPYSVVVALVDSDRPAFECTLLIIGTGQLHLRSDRWIEPGRRIAAYFDHIALEGDVTYCKRRTEDYLVCVDLARQPTQSRREPRFPI